MRRAGRVLQGLVGVLLVLLAVRAMLGLEHWLPLALCYLLVGIGAALLAGALGWRPGPRSRVW